MDSQALFNVIVGVSGALGGWVLKIIWSAIRTLDADIKQLGQRMHQEFVRRDDFKESTLELKSDMRHGFDKLEELIGALFKRLEAKADK